MCFLPAARLAEYGVTVTDPGVHLSGLFGETGDEVASTVIWRAGDNRNPLTIAATFLGRVESACGVSLQSCVLSTDVCPPG